MLSHSLLPLLSWDGWFVLFAVLTLNTLAFDWMEGRGKERKYTSTNNNNGRGKEDAFWKIHYIFMDETSESIGKRTHTKHTSSRHKWKESFRDREKEKWKILLFVPALPFSSTSPSSLVDRWIFLYFRFRYVSPENGTKAVWWRKKDVESSSFHISLSFLSVECIVWHGGNSRFV